MKKIILIIIILVILIIGGAGYYLFFIDNMPSPAVPSPITVSPSPVSTESIPAGENAYDNYKKMESMFDKDGGTLHTPTSPQYMRLLNLKNIPTSQDIPVLHQLIEQYKPALDEYEQFAQKQRCQFPSEPLPKGPLTYTQLTSNTSIPIPNFLIFQIASKLMVLKGKLAELENRPEEAVHCYISVIKAGNHFNQNSLIYRLIGVASSNMGIQAMIEFLNKPNSVNQANFAFEAMKEIEPPQELNLVSLSDFEAGLRIKDITDISESVKETLEKIASPSLSSASTRYIYENAKQELAYLGAALRAYQSQNQKMPETLDSLTPSILTNIPKDPFSGMQLHYINHGAEVLIYSVGPDKIDDQGRTEFQPNSNMTGNGDIVARLAVQ